MLTGTGGKQPRITAFIPARGGSKGIPRKNIQKLYGKPLIAYTIEAALKIPGLDRVIVSTDDEEIARVARDFGAEVPFLRPPKLATDEAEINAALSYTRHELARREGYMLQCEITLYPTHPFRSRSMIEELTGRLVKGHKHVVTAVPKSPPPLGYFYLDSHNRPRVLQDSGTHPGKRAYTRKSGCFLGTNYWYPRLKPYLHILDDPITQIDIDDWDDFLVAEEVLRQKLFDFES